MKLVALLPMKANSERVKGKNFRDFCGKPLFQWILDELTGCHEIDSIVINTDAEYLLNASFSTHEKVIVRERPYEIRGDLVSMNLIIEDDILNTDGDIYFMTHTTNPLLTRKTIAKAIKLYKSLLNSGKADSLFSVNKIQTRFYDKEARPTNHDPDNLLRTQDLEPYFEENSNLECYHEESKIKIKFPQYLLPLPKKT